MGQAQLHPRLKADARVRSVEGVNLRHPWPSFRSDAAKLADLKAFDALWPDSGADGVVIDVSFIGLRYVLDQAIACLAPGGWCVALIKPQFELGADPSERKRLFQLDSKQLGRCRLFDRQIQGLNAKQRRPDAHGC
ncbi:MAG: hypothetical protein EBW39_09445, partial [Betaproteobacteria bacterium]|nr:hypothetical protein [Betaproteobacteria bacterium]